MPFAPRERNKGKPQPFEGPIDLAEERLRAELAAAEILIKPPGQQISPIRQAFQNAGTTLTEIERLRNAKPL
jgi:hypothetical protein